MGYRMLNTSEQHLHIWFTGNWVYQCKGDNVHVWFLGWLSSKPANWTFQMGRHGQRNHLCHLLGPIGTSASPVCSDLEQPESQCWKGVKGGCIGYISILSWSNKMLGLWNHNKKMQVYQLHSWFCYWISFNCAGHISHIPIFLLVTSTALSGLVV
jgi:hypothetical protein